MNKLIFGVLLFLLFGTSVYFVQTYFTLQKKMASDHIPNNVKFSSNAWARASRRERGQMLNYLLDSVGLINKSKNEIRILLGSPDDEIVLEDGEYKSRYDYLVDKGDAFSYTLILFFDSSDRLQYTLLDD
jgi:hypothetical protein